MNHDKCHSIAALRKKISLSHSAHLKKNQLGKHYAFVAESSQQSQEEEQSNQQQQSSNNMQVKSSWLQEDNRRFVSLFNRLGPDWAEISRQIQNKTISQVKSHFFLLLRKIIRKLNLELKEKGKRQIAFTSLKKNIQQIFQGKEESNAIKSLIKENLSHLITHFLSEKQSQTISLQQLSENLQNIMVPLKSFRKHRHAKSKLQSSSSSQLNQETKRIEEGYLSDQSSVDKQQRQEKSILPFACLHQKSYLDEQQNEVSEQNHENGVIIQQNQQRIKALLRQSGILQMSQHYSSKDLRLNFQQSVASSSQYLHNESDQNFCLDYQNQILKKKGSNDSQNV